MLKKFLRDESGATAIEYSLIAAVMAVIVLAVFGLLQTGLQDTINNINTTMKDPKPAAPAAPAPGG